MVSAVAFAVGSLKNALSGDGAAPFGGRLNEVGGATPRPGVEFAGAVENGPVGDRREPTAGAPAGLDGAKPPNKEDGAAPPIGGSFRLVNVLPVGVGVGRLSLNAPVGVGVGMGMGVGWAAAAAGAAPEELDCQRRGREEKGIELVRVCDMEEEKDALCVAYSSVSFVVCWLAARRTVASLMPGRIAAA